MMKLQTKIEIPASPWKIGYEDKILMMGSCFSDEIGEQMKQHYLHVVSNPFGTLYNPLSIAQALQMTEMPELVEYQGLWHSMGPHIPLPGKANLYPPEPPGRPVFAAHMTTNASAPAARE